VWKYEDQYRGREFPGFTNYRTFEDIIKEQIIELEEPAVEILNNVIGTCYRPHEAVTWETLVCLTIFFFQNKLMFSLLEQKLQPGYFRVGK